MNFTLYDDIKPFYQATYDVLMRHEAQNIIPLGNLIIGNEGKDTTGWRDTKNWFMATVSDSTGIKLTAIMTPPHNMTLYATDNQLDVNAVDCLVDGMLKAKVHASGVMTENSLAESFAKVYADKAKTNYKTDVNMRVYELTAVNPAIPSIGNLRLAKDSDMSFLPYWRHGFATDCNLPTTSLSEEAENGRYVISIGKLYILEDNGVPVSMARITREMQSVCGVAFVYTPPYFRGKGYASSCVADISRLILKQGFTKCVLYTNLANPTSNSIYQNIGYKPICDSLDIKFIN